MHLTSPLRDHLEVMSSGDSTVRTSSSPSNTDSNKLTPSNQPEKDDTSTDSLLHSNLGSNKVNFASDASDFEPPSAPLHSSDTSESGENLVPHLRREVTSLDAVSLDEEVGDISKRDTKSAFEITGFRPAHLEDLERSGLGARHPQSTDSLREDKGSGEFDDSVINTDERHQVADTETSVTQTQTVNFTIPAEKAGDAVHQNLASSSSSTLMNAEDVSSLGQQTSNASVSTTVTVGTASTNGTSVQPNRFRRVNRYERGRWTVRDSLVTEEQADNTLPQHRKPSTKLHDPNDIGGSTSPKIAPQFDSVASSEHTEYGLAIMGIPPNDAASDKDSSSIHMDRSSTAADTLSRNTSLSSINAPEKSVDGDELIRDIDAENIPGPATTLSSNSGVYEPETLDTTASPQPPIMITATEGEHPPPSTTTLQRDDTQALPHPSTLQNVRRVQHAMSVLQSELQEVLTSSSNSSTLMVENRLLKQQQTVMEQESSSLRQELRSTKEQLAKTLEDNSKLKQELKELKQNLSKLAGSGDSNFSVMPTESSDVLSHSSGGSEQQVAQSSSNNDTSSPPRGSIT